MRSAELDLGSEMGRGMGMGTEMGTETGMVMERATPSV